MRGARSRPAHIRTSRPARPVPCQWRLGHEVPTALLPSFLPSTLGAPAAARGLIAGIADGCADFAASAIAGVLWTTISARAAFSYVAPWMLLSLLVLTSSKAGLLTSVRTSNPPNTVALSETGQSSDACARSARQSLTWVEIFGRGAFC